MRDLINYWVCDRDLKRFFFGGGGDGGRKCFPVFFLEGGIPDIFGHMT